MVPRVGAVQGVQHRTGGAVRLYPTILTCRRARRGRELRSGRDVLAYAALRAFVGEPESAGRGSEEQARPRGEATKNSIGESLMRSRKASLTAMPSWMSTRTTMSATAAVTTRTKSVHACRVGQ